MASSLQPNFHEPQRIGSKNANNAITTTASAFFHSFSHDFELRAGSYWELACRKHRGEGKLISA